MELDADFFARCNANPLYQTIGIHLDEARGGDARSTLTPRAEVCWPSPGQPHGGILFTTIDTTMAFAVMSGADPNTGCATVDCSIQYPAPARHGPFVCEAVTTHKSGRTVFVRAEIRDVNAVLVALGQGTFRIIAPKKI